VIAEIEIIVKKPKTLAKMPAFFNATSIYFRQYLPRTTRKPSHTTFVTKVVWDKPADEWKNIPKGNECPKAIPHHGFIAMVWD